MNLPVHQQSSQPKTPTSSALSERLTARLDANQLEQIATDPVLLAEVKAAMPALIAAARHPAGQVGVKQVIGSRFALFPQPERSDPEWAEWWADYFDVLAHLPSGALEAGMAAWVRQPDAEFMPKPGKLYELATKTQNRAAIRFERAQAAIDFKPTAPPVATPRGREEPTAADKELVRRMMEDFRVKCVPSGKLKPAPMPPTHGPTDERGVTDLMRSKLRRDEAA